MAKFADREFASAVAIVGGLVVLLHAMPARALDVEDATDKCREPGGRRAVQACVRAKVQAKGGPPKQYVEASTYCFGGPPFACTLARTQACTARRPPGSRHLSVASSTSSALAGIAWSSTTRPPTIATADANSRSANFAIDHSL